MVFDPNIPAANDLLSISQGDIQTNFSQTNTIIAVDHYEFDNATVADRGKHKSVVLPEDVAIATGANEAALYTKDDGTQPALYYRQESNGTEIKMTGIDPLQANDGYTFLQGTTAGGGILLQWGQGTFPVANDLVVIVFPVAFSAAPYSVTGTRFSANTDDRLFYVLPGSVAAAQVTFNRRHNNDNHTFNWFAIGPA